MYYHFSKLVTCSTILHVYKFASIIQQTDICYKCPFYFPMNVYCTCIYVGYQLRADKFFTFFLLLLLASLSRTSIAFAISAIVKSRSIALVMYSMISIGMIVSQCEWCVCVCVVYVCGCGVYVGVTQCLYVWVWHSVRVCVYGCGVCVYGYVCVYVHE